MVHTGKVIAASSVLIMLVAIYVEIDATSALQLEDIGVLLVFGIFALLYASIRASY